MINPLYLSTEVDSGKKTKIKSRMVEFRNQTYQIKSRNFDMESRNCELISNFDKGSKKITSRDYQIFV